MKFQSTPSIPVTQKQRGSPEHFDLHWTILQQARDLIADPGRWHKGSLAARADGEPVPWADKQASKWCATGALYVCALRHTKNLQEAERLGLETASMIYPKHCALLALQGLNDGAGQHFVLALFERTLRKREPQNLDRSEDLLQA